jgi:hypothetical protein
MNNLHFNNIFWHIYRLCGIVVRTPYYRSRGPCSIPGATKFFWEVVGLDRGPLSLVSTTEEQLERKSSGSGLESREYGRGDPLLWPHDSLHPQKLVLTSPTSGGRSVSIVRSPTEATEFSLFWHICSNQELRSQKKLWFVGNGTVTIWLRVSYAVRDTFSQCGTFNNRAMFSLRSARGT